MMRVGISIMTGDRQNVWNNGLVQNIYHFAGLIASIPFVEAVYLLNCGDREEHPEGSDEKAKQIPLIRPVEALDILDVAVEMGGAINVEWIRRFRYRGGKFILHLCGQPYVSLIEPTIFNRQGFFIDAERFEEIWLLAKDMVFAPMLRTIHRCPVHEVPYLWSPRFLEQTIKRDANGRTAFGYRTGSLTPGAIRAAIFEPNISPIKMGLIPYMICEAVERAAPQAIDRVTFLNGEGMAGHPSYAHLMKTSSLYMASKVQITGRDYFARIMERGGNVVISHQLNCPQNYLYLDALYGLYPLVHNSKMFADFGYFYRDSDIREGVKALNQAVECHDRNLDDYARRSSGLIGSLAPNARRNIDHYARRLVGLMSSTQRRRPT